MTNQRFCTSCGAAVRATAKFCHRCGTPSDGAARPSAPGVPAGGQQVLPWAVAGIALLCLLAFIVGQNIGRTPAPAASVTPANGGPARALDISQMGPEERADRLFQRVMTYVAEGKSDSVAFFAPMAIQSQLALAPLDAHRRYDLGLLGMVSGDGALARAQADTILAANPDHLLGLVLAMRSAGMNLDGAGRDRFAKRLLEAAERERARGLAEYADHEPDLTAALREAANPATSAVRTP